MDEKCERMYNGKGKHKNCGMCKEIEEINFYNKSSTNEKGELTKVLKVQLVTKIFDNKGNLCGQMGYRAREINFCPQCGKKIEEHMKKWRI